mmetsp:Transcript_16976/g.30554  ORF Transcript_16976/g.30554 Transcript_16976/m.30554 type:complete len:548 (+) Transcript_16976:7220-8863(+)
MKFSVKDATSAKSQVGPRERESVFKFEAAFIDDSRARLTEHCRSFLKLNSYDFSLNELKLTLGMMQTTNPLYTETVLDVLSQFQPSPKLTQLKAIIFSVGNLPGYGTEVCDEPALNHGKFGTAQEIEDWIALNSQMTSRMPGRSGEIIEILRGKLRSALNVIDIPLLGSALRSLVLFDSNAAISEWQGSFYGSLASKSLQKKLEALIKLESIFLIEPSGRIKYESYSSIKQLLSTSQATVEYADLIDTCVRSKVNTSEIVNYAFLVVDRDLLELHYRRDLVNRLLDQPDLTLEKKVLGKLADQISLELMVQPRTLISSYEETEKFSQGVVRPVLIGKEGWNKLIAQNPNDYEWDLLPSLQQFKLDLERFSGRYKETYRSRSVTWLFGLSTLILSYKQASLHVTYAQAAVLLCFNQAKQLSLSKLSEMLPGLKQDVLSGAVSSMTEILDIAEGGISLKALDKFTYKLIPAKKASASEQKTVRLEHDYVIDAAIMRVMKRSRVLDYSDLLDAMRGEGEWPEAKIRVRVEALIKKEFIREVKEGCFAYVP